MKKSVFLFLALGLFFASCTQEYTCQCVIKYTGNPPGIPDSQTVEFMIRDKKDEAAKLCEANSTTVTQFDITMDEKCRLY